MFIQPLEAELGAKSSHAAGRSHGIANSHEYFARMEAINFTQAHDDGATTRDLDKAQVILVGVSRCGKTPTSLYLALQFGIRAANFPLTPDDFADRRLPASVVAAPREALRPHDPARAAARDPRGAPAGQQVRRARQLPLRSARGRSADDAREDHDARHDDEVDRGDRDDDPASGEAATARLLESSANTDAERKRYANAIAETGRDGPLHLVRRFAARLALC